MNEEDLIKYFDNLIGGFNTDSWGKGSEADYINQAYNYMRKIEQENKILRENAEHNDKVVDKVNWKNRLLKEVIEEVREWLKYKAEALDEFDIPKRKETGAFWFSTRGEIDNLLQILDKVKGE